MNRDRKRHVIVLADGFVYWTGGMDFFTCNLIALLNTYNPEKYKITILFPEKRFFSRLSRLLLRIPFLNRNLCARKLEKDNWFRNFGGAHLEFFRFSRLSRFSRGYRINRKIRALKGDIALFCCDNVSINYPNIGYYGDLQHKIYPQFFSKQECKLRDRVIQNILSKRKYILVNSQDTKEQIEHYYPNCSASIVALPFSPLIMDRNWLDPLPYNIQKKYGITAPFFMISNQFWLHKGHKTAFKAFSKLSSEVHMVCTGSRDDYRSPGYYAELLKLIKDLGIGARLHLLGYIPKRDQVELMKESIGIVQPTLMEGGPGGGAVNTAIGLGVPAICSNIPVNLEIRNKGVHFFKLEDSDDLAVKMKKLIEHKEQRPTKDELLYQREKSLKQLGEALLEPIEMLMCNSKHSDSFA